MHPCSLNTLGKGISVGQAYKRFQELNISDFKYNLGQDSLKYVIGKSAEKK